MPGSHFRNNIVQIHAVAVSAPPTMTAEIVIRYDSLRILEREADYEKWRRIFRSDSRESDSECQ